MLLSPEFLTRLEYLTLVSRQAMAGQSQGLRRSIQRGQSIEFADFRAYTPGDDFRRIDWNAYARLGRLFVKLFIEEEDLTIHLLVDSSRSMDWGDPNKFLYARRLAAALAFVALHGLDRVTLTAFAPQEEHAPPFFPPQRSKDCLPALFTFLENLPISPHTHLGKRLQRYAAQPHPKGPLLLLSDLFDPTWQQGIHALSRRGYEITLLHILAPQEWEPDISGEVRLRDVESGARLEVSMDEATLRRYQHALHAWQGEIRTFCQARQVLYVPVNTGTPLETLLFAHLGDLLS
ncbi:MAG: DUF58 domain-containing protein [Anaerolineae bacterium]|nr:MAG: DUF58 domain-containing protein [Anaerolineae bacterium]